MKKLKPCPFCGNKKAVEIIDSADTEEVDFFCVEKVESDYHIICNVSKGGCGASSGYADTKDEAIKAWNRRDYVEC